MPRTPATKQPLPARQAAAHADSYRGHAGELQQQAAGQHPVLTTQQGIAVPDNQNTLRPSPHGPARPTRMRDVGQGSPAAWAPFRSAQR